MNKFVLISWILIGNIYATDIRVALVDNPPPKWTSEEYQKYYMNGINVGLKTAKLDGINYIVKVFEYKEPAINIFSKIKDINGWNPDIIIGPRVSEHFLLLKNEFKDILVLSPYATSGDVYKMPSNFYTMAVSANYSAIITGKYMKEQFKSNTTAYVFTDIACKTCVDFEQGLVEYLNSEKIKNIEVKFIDDNIVNKQVNYREILKNYKTSDVIVLNCTGYSAGLLIANISNSIKKENIFFLGGDGWGTYKDWDIAKIHTPYTYHAIRITPKSINPNDKSVREFIVKYKKIYNTDPDAISYITYNTINSVTAAIKYYNCNIKLNRENILCSYKKAISKNLQWRRPTVHEVYEMKEDNEYFITDIK